MKSTLTVLIAERLLCTILNFVIAFTLTSSFVVASAQDLVLQPQAKTTNLADGFINVRNFGAVGNGIEDDTLAIQTAIDQRGIIYLPPGTYRISTPLKVSSNTHLIGATVQSVIRQHTSNSPILVLNGERLLISNLKLQFASPQSPQNQNAAGIRINRLYESIIEKLYIDGAYRGIELDHPISGNSSFMYSCSLRDIRITRYSNHGLYFRSNNAFSTGNVFLNIYINNWDDFRAKSKTQAKAGAHFQNFSESFAAQLNVEHTISDQAFVFNNCNAFTLYSFHIEGVDPVMNYSGYFSIHRANVRIAGGTLMFSNINAEHYALFKLDDNSKLFVENVLTRDISGKGINRWLFYSTSRTGEIEANGISSDIFKKSSLPAIHPPILRRLNENFFHYKLGGMNISYGSSPPSSGKWNQGDKIYNTEPIEQGSQGRKYVISGWICTHGGSPGTWTPMQALTGN